MFNLKLYDMGNSIDYKELIKKEGWEKLSHIWTVFLTKNPDLWVNPFQNLELRFRSMFFDTERCIYIYLTQEEIKRMKILETVPDEIFFSGAFNQVIVFQIRSFGKIKIAEVSKKYYFLSLLKDRLNGKNIIFDNFRKGSFNPDEKEKREALKSLNSEGELYCFILSSYAEHIFERG